MAESPPDFDRRLRELLAELVAIPSYSGAEGAIQTRLEAVVRELGAPVTRVPTPNGHDNLVVGAVDDPTLAIVAHVDTITPPWPCGPTVRDMEVAGLGAVDDKGGVVACLGALHLLAAQGVALDGLPATIAFSVDEEEGGTGSAALADVLRPPYAIALEGTRLRPALAEAGGVVGTLEVRGEPAHGALVEIGENAIARAARLIADLPALGLDTDLHPLLGCGAIDPFKITGGSDLYQVPDTCSVFLRARVMPATPAAEVCERIEAFAEERGAIFRRRDVFDAFETPAESPIARAVASHTARVTGAEPSPIGMGAWTDAHSFVDVAGSQALVFGPGDLATAHRPDERIDVREIAACAHVFAGLLSAGSLAELGATVV